MGLLSGARDAVGSAKDKLDSTRDRIGRLNQETEEVQDDVNHYNDLEEQTEEFISKGKKDAARREAEELEEGGEELAQEVERLDRDLFETLDGEYEALKDIARALKQRENFEKKVRNKVRSLVSDEGDGVDHEEFDQRLDSAIGKLEHYIRESKDGSGMVYRSSVGREAKTDQGKNWQKLALEAQDIRDSVQKITQMEDEEEEVVEAEEQALEEFREEWEQTLQDLKEVRDNIDEMWIAEEEEMEKIATQLQDNMLLQKLKPHKGAAVEVGEFKDELNEKVKQIESILYELEKEEENILELQVNSENAAEELKRMSSQALDRVGDIEDLVFNGEAIFDDETFEKIGFKSEDKWEKEIRMIEEAMNEVQSLVEKFEQIEQQEINIEEQEEELVEEEESAGGAVLDSSP